MSASTWDVAAIKFLENAGFYVDGPVPYSQGARKLREALKIARASDHILHPHDRSDAAVGTSWDEWRRKDESAMTIIVMSCGELGPVGVDLIEGAGTAIQIWEILRDYHAPRESAMDRGMPSSTSLASNLDAHDLRAFARRMWKQNLVLRTTIQQLLNRVGALESEHPVARREPPRIGKAAGCSSRPAIQPFTDEDTSVAAIVWRTQQQIAGTLPIPRSEPLMAHNSLFDRVELTSESQSRWQNQGSKRAPPRIQIALTPRRRRKVLRRMQQATMPRVKIESDR